jgi:L-alanine-DL-glutamate epimerase-like enolase superfamily enzyme
MRIARVTATRLRCPIPAASRPVGGFVTMESFSTVLVRIETDSGLVGFGETKAGGAPDSEDATLAAMINDDFGPRLIGDDPRDVTRIWGLLYNGRRADSAARAGRNFPSIGRRGLSVCAIAGIDIALWDLLGKATGQPVWRLLGGRTRARLPLYASGGWAGEDGIGAELKGYIAALGAKAVKMRVGARFGNVDASIRRVNAARKAIGDDIELMVDAHGSFGVAEAKWFARGTAEARLRWFEEPVSGDQKSALADVRAASVCALAAGENDFTRFDFLPYLSPISLDVFQPDLGVCGGLSEALRISALASAYQIEVSPHVWAGTVLMAATAHFAVACPQVAILEYPAAANPMLDGIGSGAIQIVDGSISVSDAPGLGLEIDEEFVSQWAQ